MAEKLSERVRDYKPSKVVWFWSSAACVALTAIVGFTWGGWVTGGAAEERARIAANEATAQLAAAICASNFLAAPDAGVQLAALKEKRASERNALLEKGGWVTFAGSDKPVKGAGKACADLLAEAEAPVVSEEVVPVAEAPVTDLAVDAVTAAEPVAN